MSDALDKGHHLPAQTAMGKGKVSEPKKEDGREGIIITAAIFFDGTKNNRTNSKMRMTGRVKVPDDDESSYANFYSNVAIMELLNSKRQAAEHQVSVYVEGIGTNNFVNGATKPAWYNKDKRIPVADDKNGQDDTIGYAIGSGTTGIVDRVTAGISRLRTQSLKVYNPQDYFVEKVIIDVVGFSRGAAAARHFVHRRQQVSTGWLNQKSSPVIEINFVAIYDTVSSYESLKGGLGEAGLYLASLELVPTGNPLIPVVPLNPHMMSTDRIFGDDVLQLGLDMHDVPKKVVHLTAQDEYRENFSLTNINTTLNAHRGVEASLPGVHSDIGGGYAEGNAENYKRTTNKETRRIHDQAEKVRLIHDGWYTRDQFKPYKQVNTPAVPSIPVIVPVWPPIVLKTSPISSHTFNFWENGERYLTHEYQLIPLYIMMGFARRGGPHIAMEFYALSGQNAQYLVPARLTRFRDYFDGEVRKLDGHQPARKKWELSMGTKIEYPDLVQTKWLRNNFLHRSARLPTEFKVGMAGREDAGRDGHHRQIIPDDKLTEKPQDTIRRETKASIKDKLNRLRNASDRALDALRRGAERGLEEMGKNPMMYPPF